MALSITPLYAALLAILMMVLSLSVSVKRGQTGISILHGDNLDLALTMRRFGNFIENAPYGLLLLLMMELQGASSVWLHSVGGLLVASRILHPLGLNTSNAKAPLRIFAGLLNKASNLAAVVFLLWTTVS